MKIVTGKFTKKMWVESEDGRRITDKYYHVKEYGTIGNFIFIATMKVDDIGVENNYLVINKLTEKLLAISDKGPSVVTDKVFQWQRRNMFFWSDITGTIVREGLDCCTKYEQEQLIRVRNPRKELYYLLNYDLQEVAGPYKYLSRFDDFGYAIVKDTCNSRLAIINNRLENILTTDKYDGLKSLSEQYFLTKSNSQKGVIDITGKEIIPCLYDDVVLVSGYFKVTYNGKFGLIDKDGKTIFECIYPEIIETPDKFVVQDFAKLIFVKTKEVTK